MTIIRKFILVLLALLACSSVSFASYDMEYGDNSSAYLEIIMLNPLDGSLRINSDFSLIGRAHPVFGDVRPHKGVDLDAGTGENIYAAIPGTVTYSGWAEGYGYVVYIHSVVNSFDVETRYAHCSALLVGEGLEVGAVTIIAKVGETGWATGPHLHFEVRINGEPVNPRRYLRGLAPSSGMGYAVLPPSVKNSFDAAYDFGKPLREVIEKFGDMCQTAMKSLLATVKWLLLALITIDLALGASMFVIDENKGENLGSIIFSMG